MSEHIVDLLFETVGPKHRTGCFLSLVFGRITLIQHPFGWKRLTKQQTDFTCNGFCDCGKESEAG